MRHLLSRVRRFIRFETRTVALFLVGYPAVRRTQVLRRSTAVGLEWLETPAGITNPSITTTGSGLIIAARTATYRLSQLRRSMVPIPGRTRTITYLLTPRDATAGGSYEVVEVQFPESASSREFEDARVFEWRGSLWGLWSESQLMHDGRYLNSMVLGRIDGHRVVELISVASPHGREREKNWMPIVDGARLFFMYDLKSLEVYELLPDGLRRVHRAPMALPQLRKQSGSSQFVRYEGGWLGVSHRSFIRPLVLPWLAFAYYRHSLVALNEDFSLRAVSSPFFFTRRAIEFCAGLALEGEKAVFSFGADDARAALLTMERTQMADLLASGLKA